MANPLSVAVSLLVLFFSYVTASGAASDSAATRDTAQQQQPKQAAPVAAKDTSQKTPAAIGAPASAKPAALPNKKPVEEDLDEEMLLPEKGAPQPVQAAPAPAAAKTAAMQQAADTSKAAGAAPVRAPAGPAAETGKPAQVPGVGALADTSKKAAAQKTVAPVRIEEARPINFARNLKDYRSPKLAMFLSLLVPGLGQAYVKSYVKAGLFIAAEAAIIGASVVYSNKGSSKYNQATAFADRNYSVSTMQNYYTQLLAFMGGDTTAQGTLNGIYYDTVPNANSSLSQGSKTKSHGYYTLIAQPEYIQGWKDCQPTFSQIQNLSLNQKYSTKGGTTYTLDSNLYQVDINGNPANAAYGYSDSLIAYKALMSQSNSDYKTATNILFIILVNHIVSAVDALISARIYNDELLGKQSFWNHIDLEPSVAAAGTMSGPALSLRIKF